MTALQPKIHVLPNPISIPSRILSGRPNRPCRIASCPLNEAGIQHNVGLYKHNGRKNSLGVQDPHGIPILFGDANPPYFIWAAAEERTRALEKVRLGQDADRNWEIAYEMEGILRRFCELHAV